MTRSSGISHIATLLATFTLSTSQVAFASEVTPYDGSLCRGVTYEDQENITRDDGDLSVSGETLVVCPIVKTTSGPGVWWGDEISNVSLSFTSASATCWLTIYSANTYGSHSESNAIEVDSGSISSSTISLSSSTAGYWIGMEAHHTWFYPELYCDISSGTLNGYTVTESGTDQAPNRITSAANCEQTTDGDYYVFVGPGEPASYPPYDPGLFGGYVESIGSGFDLECPVLPGAGNAIEIALGPSISYPPNNPMGCETTDTNTWQYTSYTGYDFPPQVLTYTQTTPSPLICAMYGHPANGDGKVFSYRTAESTDDFTGLY